MKQTGTWAGIICAAVLCFGSAQAKTDDNAATTKRLMIIAKAVGLPGEIAFSDSAGTSGSFTLGLADREAHRPHRRNARWLWASVTKQVTAVLVMQQVEAGTLALDGTIRRYLPDFAGANGDRITLRQLLQHVSGLPNPDDTAPDADHLPPFYTVDFEDLCKRRAERCSQAG